MPTTVNHHTSDRRVRIIIGAALSPILALGLIAFAPSDVPDEKASPSGGQAIGEIVEADEAEDEQSLLAGLFSVEAAAAASTPTPEVWFGAPSSSTWPDKSGCSGATYPSAKCSWPTVHHTYFYGDAYRGDWGIDIGAMSVGEQVKLYAAPQNTKYNASTTARVLRVVPACSASYQGESTASRVSRGGYAVVVELRIGSTLPPRMPSGRQGP